ncbi:class I SAM-dependent methyltransferase [Paremcibacter congregatus]|uniref:class I SAM-dependent methyltransferase n=1 Tax=Paremcibacter congregatus TaxID=2043170 RepID=UPI00195DA1D5|nr:class I SAM-dependent methyltransferase [Paremcibacter congregatus]
MTLGTTLGLTGGKVKAWTLACIGAVTLSVTAAPVMAKTLDEVIAGDHRSAKNKARDSYRHPKETLEFFGLQPDMTVVEIWPGGGWYQEILAPYLHEKGTYYGAGYDVEATRGYRVRALKETLARKTEMPDLYGTMKITELSPPAKLEIAPAGSADMVLSFRNFHNWKMGGTEDQVLGAIYKALKPGGIFGITDHRNENSAGRDGYVKPSDLMAAAQKAGFVFVAKSEVNANPKDTKDHERGVWTLPPSLSGNPENHDKMRSIGESDRLTYKFMKPVK